MGFNTGQSSSSSSNESQSSQGVWDKSQPFFEGLYGAAGDKSKAIAGAGDYSTNFLGPALNAWQSFLSPQQNPYLQENVRGAQSMAAEGFNENILPGIQQAAASVGAIGGSRSPIAVTQAARDATREQGRIASSMYGAGYESNQGRMMQALGMTGGLAGLQASSFAPLLALSQILGRPTVLGQSSAGGRAESDSWNLGASLWKT
jgi:hypothetical protein